MLDHRLDDQPAVLHVGQVGGEGDPPDQCGLVLLGELPALDRPVRGVLHVLAAALERLVGLLHAHDVVTVAGEHLGDARAHRAQPDHADAGKVPSSAFAHERHPVMRPGACAVRYFTARTASTPTRLTPGRHPAR